MHACELLAERLFTGLTECRRLGDQVEADYLLLKIVKYLGLTLALDVLLASSLALLPGLLAVIAEV